MAVNRSRRAARRRWRLSFMVTLILAATAFVFPVTASAASNHPARHCTAQLAPLEVGQKASRILSQACFATFSEAIAFASGGRIHVGPNATPKDISPESLTSGFVLGIDFQNGSFSGSSFTATGSTECTGGHNFAITSMPGGWDNIVSSNYPSSGCNRARHWENTSYGGALIDCRPDQNCYYIGNAMNDRTSSEEWFDV